MATIHIIDSFEHGAIATGAGGLYDANSGTPVNSTTLPRTGSRSMEFTPATVLEFVRFNTTTLGSGVRTLCGSLYLRFSVMPTTATVLAHVGTATNNYIVAVDSTGHLGVDANNGSSVVWAGADGVMTTGTWYRITYEVDTQTGTGSIKAAMSGMTDLSDTVAAAATDITTCAIGATLTNGTGTYYIDDWIVSITDGDYETIKTWTSHKIEAIIPNADGTHGGGWASGDFDSFTATAFTTSTTNGNTFIAHRPMQRANTADQVIRQDLGATDDYMEFTLENLADNTVTVGAVRALGCYVEASTTNASLGEMRLLLSDSTEVLTTGSLSVINSTEDPGNTVTVKRRMTIAPSGGWDGTKVDGLKVRVGFGDAVPDVNFIDSMIEVMSQVETAATNLVIQDAALALSADNLALTQEHVLAIQDASLAHAADNMVLTQVHNLVVQDAAHALAADNIDLTQAHNLVVADAALAHTADNLTLTENSSADLVIQDAALAHSADNIVITQAHQLVIADASLAHTADNLTLTQDHTLQIQDASLALTADNVTIALEGVEPEEQHFVKLRRKRRMST